MENEEKGLEKVVRSEVLSHGFISGLMFGNTYTISGFGVFPTLLFLSGSIYLTYLTFNLYNRYQRELNDNSPNQNS